MDLRYVGVGDIAKFKVMPNSLYTVSKGGRAERTTFRQRKHAGDIIVAPQEHIVTIYVNMYSVLAGKESIAEFVRLVVTAVEQDMYAEAVAALTTGLSALSAPYSYTGAFDMATLLNMAEQVQVYNQGVRPVIAGTAVALMNVIPDSASGYRGNYDANGGSINLLRGVYGFDVLKLDQAAAKNGGLVLPNDKIFVVSPSQDKLVKGAVSNAMTNSNQFYDNADLTEDFTYRKNYAFTYASAAKAAVYNITD
nr:MAG TPA: capsid protein [Caudoviricetes sp.]